MNILGAFSSLWNSEKALAGGVLIIAATVLAALGNMATTEWIDYTKWIFGIYVAGKTTQSAVSTIAASKTSVVAPTTTPEPAKEA